MDAPRALEYDTLPSFTRLTRVERDGCVTITAPAQEPTGEVRWAVAREVVVSSALWAAGVLALVLLVFGGVVREHRRFLPWWVAVLFAIFCLAVFLLVWWGRYAARLETVEKALRQATVLSADGRRLLIESAGPWGAGSYVIERERVGGLRVGVVAVPALVGGVGQVADALSVVLTDGGRVDLLPGRQRSELRWVAGVISRAMGLGVAVEGLGANRRRTADVC